jgi:hypothetical protein
MHTEYQRAGFFIFFHHEAHEEHIFVPLRGLIFPYNPDHPVYPVKKRNFFAVRPVVKNNMPWVKTAGFIFLPFPLPFVIPAPICHSREGGNP